MSKDDEDNVGKKVKVKVSLFNVGSSVSLQNCYQLKPTVRPLPPPSVSARIVLTDVRVAEN